MKRSMNYRVRLLVVFIGLQTTVFSQQEPQFLQYMDNMLYYNPAYAGSREMLNLSALHRQQWIGVSGSPVSSTFQCHTPLKYESVGVGLSVVNDKLGPINASWINADFSYSLEFKNKGKLSFGVKGGVDILNGDLTKLYVNDANDKSLDYRYQNSTSFNVGSGVYYHSKYWFIGAAIPRILESKTDITNGEIAAQRHYYGMVGGYFKLNRMFKIRPSAMVKITENAPLGLDLSTAVIIYDKLWLGGNYRLKESGGVFAQFQLSNQFKIGYGLEINTSKLAKYNYGTHELMLSYDFIYKHRDLASPRYF